MGEHTAHSHDSDDRAPWPGPDEPRQPLYAVQSAAHLIDPDTMVLRGSRIRLGVLFSAALCLVGLALDERPARGKSGQNREQTLNLESSRELRRPLRLRFAALDRAAGEDPPLPGAVLDRYRGQVLTGSYHVCVLSDGTVSSVKVSQGIIPDVDDVVISTLKTWRYSPQPRGTLTCTMETLSFEL